MTATTHDQRRLADLSVSELVAIRMLINGFSKIEYWICQHAAMLRSEARNTQHGGNDPATEADVRVDVCCMLRESDPSFDPRSENVMAKLDGSRVLMPGVATPEVWRDAAEPDLHALSDMRVCHLFRGLYEHGVERDWGALARIGEISVEISLVHASKAHDGA